MELQLSQGRPLCLGALAMSLALTFGSLPWVNLILLSLSREWEGDSQNQGCGGALTPPVTPEQANGSSLLTICNPGKALIGQARVMCPSLRVGSRGEATPPEGRRAFPNNGGRDAEHTKPTNVHLLFTEYLPTRCCVKHLEEIGSQRG